VWITGLAEIAEQHLIGWPTMMSPAQREARRKDADIAREHAAKLSA
jgi:ferrochelatase